MYIVNFFCDASIDSKLNIACGGCHVMVQNNGTIEHWYDKLYIQHNATNNSAEILAIWTGVVEAIHMRAQCPDNVVFRLFSDSKISLYGLRDWMKSWIKNSASNNYTELINISGGPVANQQTFIDIFNLVVENGLKIEFYHQRGHVGESGGVKLDAARVSFVKANKVSPENLGLNISILSQCNHMIDNNTRGAMKEYIATGRNEKYNAQVMMPDPMYHYIRADMLAYYISLINKTSVVSRHDFRGGYNQ